MADTEYLKDYSTLNAVSGGVQGFLKGMQDGEDRKMKIQEFDARMKSEQTKAQRDALAQKLDLFSHHATTDESGNIVPAQLTPKELAEEKLKAFGEGAKPVSVGPDGTPTDFTIDPNTPKAIAAKNSGIRAANSGNVANQSLDLRKDALDRRAHQQILNKLANDHQLAARVTQYQNLDNALSTVTQADKLTPQQIQEFQQAVRANLGIKGGSGVGEREETYFKSMGLNAANLKQFITGDPAQISKDSKLMQHLKDLANVEQNNIRKQMTSRLSAISGGQGSMYSRRPDLKQDLDDAIQGYSTNFSSGDTTQAPPPQAANPGLVQPQEGFLSKATGFLGNMFGNKAQATQAPAAHPQDAAAVSAAQQILKNPSSTPDDKKKAQTILQLNGQ